MGHDLSLFTNIPEDNGMRVCERLAYLFNKKIWIGINGGWASQFLGWRAYLYAIRGIVSMGSGRIEGDDKFYGAPLRLGCTFLLSTIMVKNSALVL